MAEAGDLSCGPIGSRLGHEGDVTGFRHLLVLLALGVDEALRTADPYDPAIAPGNVDNILKWGMDCPDALWHRRRPSIPMPGYRVLGTCGSARFMSLQVMAGHGQRASDLVAEDLEMDSDGSFELHLSRERTPGNWLPLEEGASTLVIRQFFYDWDTEEPARLAIECPSARPTRTDAAGDTDPAALVGPPDCRAGRLRARQRRVLVGH